MAKKRKEKKPKSIAHLTAYDSNGAIVVEQTMSLGEYYEGEHDLIDSSQFRLERKIVRVTGKLYDHRGTLVQEFENEYSPNGDYLHGTVRYEDEIAVKD